MAYDRYEDRGRSDWRGRQDREERGWFDRAREEVSSWFGDDRDDRGEDRWSSGRSEERWSQPPRGGARPPSSERDYERFERSPRWRDEGYRRPYTGRSMRGPEVDDRYRPMTGDYGRSSEYDRDFGGERSQPQHQPHMDRGQHERGWASAGAGAVGASGMHDRDYSSWRERQLSEFDRDYDEFRRENSSRFEDEFTNWRQQRQAKRQMLGQIREHMQVVGSDEEAVGTVDKVRGDRIILTKNDSPDGRHHAFSCSLIDRVEGDRVILDKPAEEARKQLSSEDRNRALFERDDNREDGPHMLNRSFSGTY